MSAVPRVDVRDLGSVRRAAEPDADIIVGEAYDGAAGAGPDDATKRSRRPRFRRSPLTRKIVVFNLLALLALVGAMLYLTPSRTALIAQRSAELEVQAALVAAVIDARLPTEPQGDDLAAAASVAIAASGRGGAQGAATSDAPAEIFVFNTTAQLVAQSQGAANGAADTEGSTTVARQIASRLLARDGPALAASDVGALAAAQGVGGAAAHSLGADAGPSARGAVVLLDTATDLDGLIWREQRSLLWMFAIGAIVSILLSLVLAATIANPLADLAEAAELGRDRNRRKAPARKITIPDLSARPDEIGRLSGALRGMVDALNDRIESNEQFAADVAHEIKNPLASLQSAVGTLRQTDRPDQRARLLDIVAQDVQRLDRLVSDISNASRLDSELVKEREEPFDLLALVRNINEYLGQQATDKGIDYISDLPPGEVRITGLEPRLAQVFVNLITNALSFCEDGDAIRVWSRQREGRVLVVVEDTGPGIPEDALDKVFQRFYSERPEGDFGKNSGLGLAISRQIVEAHGGVLWAENIRPTEDDPLSEPLGARFVVGLPI